MMITIPCPICERQFETGQFSDHISSCVFTERDKLKAEVERLKASDVSLRSTYTRLHEAYEDTLLQNHALKEALDLFLIGFRSRQDKLDRRWSLGYWEGKDPGMELVLGGNAESIENTRFNAVIAYTDEEIQRALKAECADSRLCVKCGKGSERFYSDRCPACYDILAAGQE